MEIDLAVYIWIYPLQDIQNADNRINTQKHLFKSADIVFFKWTKQIIENMLKRISQNTN